MSRISGPWGGRARFRDRPYSPRLSQYMPSLAGISRDSFGTPLGGCTVKIFRSWDDAMIAQTVSDGTGNWIVYPATSGPYYAVEYKAGSPDVAGTSVNTLTAS